ncbi:hypothetical protein BH10ACI3_BH10ACI3_18120 [soil metagenome]
MAETNKCGHEICSCTVTSDEKYCSSHCQEAVDQSIVEINCDCGCPGC